ncbi:uncharacterized protein [Leptinotarsa decemlineata]|uniref:uncharacterized protein n=1 Tax=Leptinotarsa decemlineata TaxID=7539 RepID=UPI003D303F7B
MNSKTYRCCAVPQCTNTSIKTPNKLFVFLPYKKTTRTKWLKLARRESTGILPSTQLYFCEDHFDLPNDMENYMQYHLMGSVSQIRMKQGCIPTKFSCQPDRRKRTSDTTKRQYILKKQRKMTIEQCEKEVEERSTIAKKQLKLEEASFGSSVLQPSVSQEDVRKTANKCIQVHMTYKFRSKAIQTAD